MNQNELREILSFNIKQKRKLYSLTQEKLAELTGLSAQTINDIEGCRTWVSDKTLVKIAEILHSSPSELLYQTDEEQKNKIDLIQLKNKLQEAVVKSISESFEKL
ncbi:MAG: helix-turn-helix transcriptional regulator [Treponema sp.]|nr:helix-turn-helix transcriptional regulator [Treponema sp.]